MYLGVQNNTGNSMMLVDKEIIIYCVHSIYTELHSYHAVKYDRNLNASQNGIHFLRNYHIHTDNNSYVSYLFPITKLSPNTYEHYSIICTN